MRKKEPSAYAKKAPGFRLLAAWKNNQREVLHIISPKGLYIINPVGIVSHQAAEKRIHGYAVMRYQGGRAALDDIPPCGG